MGGSADKVAMALLVAAASMIAVYFSPIGCRTSAPAGSARTTKMQIGDRRFTLEIADTPELREMGLMYRDSMPSDQGMIFIFPNDQQLSFWMKNTRIPLDIIYVNAQRKVVSVKSMKPHSLASVPSDDPAKYAIELNEGMAKKAGVKVGDVLELPKDLPEVKN